MSGLPVWASVLKVVGQEQYVKFDSKNRVRLVSSRNEASEANDFDDDCFITVDDTLTISLSDYVNGCLWKTNPAWAANKKRPPVIQEELKETFPILSLDLEFFHAGSSIDDDFSYTRLKKKVFSEFVNLSHNIFKLKYGFPPFSISIPMVKDSYYVLTETENSIKNSPLGKNLPWVKEWSGYTTVIRFFIEEEYKNFIEELMLLKCTTEPDLGLYQISMKEIEGRMQHYLDALSLDLYDMDWEF